MHPTIIIPVIDERNDETDPCCFGGSDDGVKFAETAASGVDGSTGSTP